MLSVKDASRRRKSIVKKFLQYSMSPCGYTRVLCAVTYCLSLLSTLCTYKISIQFVPSSHIHTVPTQRRTGSLHFRRTLVTPCLHLKAGACGWYRALLDR
ncbi:hypothetical protein K523DRAFT_150642 [Schizophyllum commune Tattone D]|nr:hypothetical protein K523DRAFT_150642 [Schizophyllum commune Tattone D]